MTELRRSPVPGIFCGLRMFVFAYSISLAISAIFYPDIVSAYFLPMLALSLSFAVVFACVETVQSITTVVIIIAAGAAFDLLLLPGSLLGPQITASPSALPYLLCMATLVASSVVYRTTMNKSRFSGASLSAHMLALVALSLISGALDNDLLRIVLYYAALAYIPLGVANMFALTTSEFFDHMHGRTTQPIALFRRRVTASSARIILILCAFLVMLPSVDFSFMRKVYGQIFLAIVKFLGMFTYVPPQEIFPTEDPYLASGGSTPDSTIAKIIGYICIGILCLCGLELLRRITIKVIRILRDFFSKGSVKQPKKAVAVNNYDTIENLEATVVKKKREKLTPAQTNAQKVRRIYKKRIENLLKKELGDISSKAPDEITELVREHGYDITELTRIYKKARYSDSCSTDDVSAAQKTKAVKL